MLKKIVIFLFFMLFVTSFTLNAQTNSENRFPWRKKWDRYQLYRMALSYYQAGNAFEKSGKTGKAKHCFIHAAKTSPYSDVGDKARQKLRNKYNRNIPDPTIGETVAWLKKQPNLTQAEKEFIEQYEKNQKQKLTEQPNAKPRQPVVPGPADPEDKMKKEVEPGKPSQGEPGEEPEKLTEQPNAKVRQPVVPGPADPEDKMKKEVEPGKDKSQAPDDVINESEIKKQGEKIEFKKDLSPPTNN